MPDLVGSRSFVKRPSRWRAWFRAAEFAVQLALAVGYGIYAFHYGGMTLHLRSVLADMDRDHPGWRLADMEARREEVPDAENSALRITEIDGLLPNRWIDDNVAEQVEKLPPRTQLTAEQFDQVSRALGEVRPAVEKARTLADMPRGRFPITYRPEGFDLPLARAGTAMHKVSRLLYLDAAVQAQAGRADAAARSIRAALNVGRALGDEPGDLAGLARANLVTVAWRGAKRLLALGEPSDDELRRLQTEWEAEGRHAYWPLAWRGERARQGVTIQAFLDGEIDFSEGGPPESLFDQTVGYWYLQDRFRVWAPVFFAEYALLEDTDDLPAHQRQAVLDRASQDARRHFNVLLLTFPAQAKVGQACARVQAAMRTGAAAFAAERYRRSHGDWPATPDLADDPFSDGRLLYHRLADGAVVYSVGQDGEDDGGDVDKTDPKEPAADLGVRLWNPAQRRQPPEAPARP